ncbi:MAG: type II secretion system F family protein [Actinobacteria bacterium]|nr:MAG: type II secretion system F family protein [Actinomycetota bacterium]
MAATYTYKVRDKQANIISGSLEAENQSAVADKLRQMGYTVISVSSKTQAPTVEELLSNIPLFQRVKSKDLTVYSRQFATMINAGLPLTRCLAILAEQTDNTYLAKVTGIMQKDVEAGQSLSAAMAKHPKAFSTLFISMIKAGEAGGVLDEVLLRIADHMQREAELKSKIKSAMAYPVVMFAITIIIAFIMITFIVPIFQGLFKSLKGTMPLPTQILISISNYMRSIYGLIFFIGFMGGVFAFRAYKRTDQGAYFWDSLKLKLPVIGSLSKKISLAKFSRTLGTLISSGTPILQALDIVADTAGNEIVSRAIKSARSSIREGETIAKPLSESDVFPPMVIQMISVGEETGALETMCGKIADFYDSEVAATVEALTSIIEPLLIVFLGVVVGGILISLYMPMFNLVNLLK